MNRIEAEKLLSLPFEELISLANKVRRSHVGSTLEICSVINAKSGRCSEDCKFCAQSSHYNTLSQDYPLRTKEEILSAARTAQKNGAQKFGIVTSGRRLTMQEVGLVAECVREIKEGLGIIPCASLGALDEDAFSILRNAGLFRYHHNIETSERFYSEIVSTHPYSERIKTIKKAKKFGLEVCSGGILGMGETWQDRIEMALLLKELEVDAVPLNFLIPIKGTPLAGSARISPLEAIRAIALFRIILKDAVVKIAAGRETVLKDFQGLIFMAGANGMMVGGYLTIQGRPVEEDQRLIGEIKKLWNEE